MEKEMVNDPVEAIVAYALSKDKGAPATRLMKLVFLAEIEHLERFGKPLCGAGFINYLYGPYSEEVSKAVDALQAREIVQETKYTTRNNRTCRLMGISRKKELWWVPPTPRAEQILDAVITRWKGRPLDDLVAAAKAKPQYQETQLLGERVPMTSHLPIPFSLPEDIDEDSLLPDMEDL